MFTICELNKNIINSLLPYLSDIYLTYYFSSDFAESLFAKTISWPLIASLLAFSGGLAIECIRNGRSILVRRICDWATIFVVMRLKNWIKQNGGWVSENASNFLTIIIWDKVFKNRPSKIFKRLYSTNFTWSILEYIFSFKMIHCQVTYNLPILLKL